MDVGAPTVLMGWPFFGTTQVSQYQKGKTNLDFTEAGDSEWQWQQLGHMQVCTLLQTDYHASTPPLSFLQFFFLRPTNSVKALKAEVTEWINKNSNKCTVLFHLWFFSFVSVVVITFSALTVVTVGWASGRASDL